MFIKFNREKANYESGQIFPYLIAVIVAIIIMAMITVNLGKLAIFKTDVSNAADAGSLAGASVLSGALLAYGLFSDGQCAKVVIAISRMIVIFAAGMDYGDKFTPHFSFGSSGSSSSSSGGSSSSSSGNSDDLVQFPQDLVRCILIYVNILITFFSDYYQALSNSMITFNNAKLQATQYAFNNIGVDEPPKIKFRNRGGDYEAYLASQEVLGGFSRLMQHQQTGYAKPLFDEIPGGEITALAAGPFEFTTGYGWNAQTSANSYDDGNVLGYASYPNYVTIKVRGSMMYPIQPLTFEEYFGSGVAATIALVCMGLSYVKYMTRSKEAGKGWWWYIIWGIYAIVNFMVMSLILVTIPVGFTFPSRDMDLYTTNNPIVVETTRFKQGTNVGVWNFNYGTTKSGSGAHAYRLTGEETIEPVFLKNLSEIATADGNFDFQTIADYIIPMVRQTLCMLLVGMAESTVLGLVYNYGDIDEETQDEIDTAMATMQGFAGGIAGMILYYYIYSEYCTSSSNNDFTGGTYNSGFESEEDDWFNTRLHLFETGLDSQYVN